MHISQLSKDIIYSIILQLSLDDIGNLYLTCKFFKDLLDDDTIYQYIYSYYLYPSPYYINTGIGVCTPENWKWKEHYREQYYLQYIYSLHSNYGVQLFHRYLNLDVDDQWTIIKEEEDYGRLGETNKPIVVCFYDLGGQRLDDDNNSLIDSIDKLKLEDQSISNHDLFDEDEDNEYISLSNENESEIIDLDNLKSLSKDKCKIEQGKTENFHSFGWVNHVSKQFTRSIAHIVDVKSLIESMSSPFRDFWVEGSKEYIQKLLIKILTKELPYSKSNNEMYHLIDTEYAKRFSKYVYNLFDMDKTPYKSYYCLTAEKSEFFSRHYEAICIVGEQRCLFMYWIWEIDNHVSFSKACKEIKSFLN